MGSGAKLGRIFAKTMGWFVSASFISLLLGLKGMPALAEDIVHDAFIKVWTAAATYDPLRGAARG